MNKVKSALTKSSTQAPRTRLINHFLSSSNTKSYLEIGVRYGENFFQVNASKKIGVDPAYFFSKRSLIKSFLHKRNWFFKMYKMESDSFFSLYKKLFKRIPLDVVFIDGMHTYEQSLEDAKNCLLNLNSEGTIIFHDCNPSCEISAQPILPQEKINWNGDVWKTIYHFRQFSNNFDCFTYDTDEGLGILRMKPKCNLDILSQITVSEEIKDLDYKFLNQNRISILGLKNFQISN